LRFHFTLQLLDCDHTPVLTTVNQSVTTATISKQNGLIRQIEPVIFHLTRITSRRGVLFSPDRASDNALGLQASLMIRLLRPRDAGIEIHQDST
jgi:hypothetical protein